MKISLIHQDSFNMGDFKVQPILNEEERTSFYSAMLRDLEAFEYMLKEGIVEQRSDMVGAEQEICIVDHLGQPASRALEILKLIKDERYTNELALFNLEVNLSPQKLDSNCFRKVEEELKTTYQIGRRVAHQFDTELFLAGNLPTLNLRHLEFSCMTPEKRYKVLSQELLKLRGGNFEIFLQGVDDFHTSLNSVLFEACNTSFQLHLQIDPREFAKMHNWSQMIAGPVLAACTNSPLLFGKELWEENRIVLFKQSLDTRGRHNHSRVVAPRVYFGEDWLEDSAIELWKKDLVRFPVLLRGYGNNDPFEDLKNGTIPKLKSIRLHNGTTYTWNRLCYGVANNSPHIRIECRYLPAGPTQIDEIANFAFWIGLMKGFPEEREAFWKDTDFQEVKNNFIKAARYGLQTTFCWFGKNYPAKTLILDKLLPIARSGLEKMNIDSSDIDRYLSIITERVERGQTGSQWLKKNHRTLMKKYKASMTQRLLVKRSIEFQNQNLPVHHWEDFYFPNVYAVSENLFTTHSLVEDLMSKEVYSIQDNISVEVIKKIFDWKHFDKHLPVEDLEGNLIGIVSKSLIDSHQYAEDLLARDIMIREVITIAPDAQINEAEVLMQKNEISCLPVVEKDKLVGIVTKRDLKPIHLQ